MARIIFPLKVISRYQESSVVERFSVFFKQVSIRSE